MGNECETMIMFQGRSGFAPNTMNNYVFNFSLAQWWQNENLKEKLKKVKNEKFTCENWMKIMRDSTELNNDWQKYKGFNWRIVDSMSIEGDGILLTELQAIAVFNPKKDDKIRILPEN